VLVQLFPTKNSGDGYPYCGSLQKWAQGILTYDSWGSMGPTHVTEVLLEELQLDKTTPGSWCGGPGRWGGFLNLLPPCSQGLIQATHSVFFLRQDVYYYKILNKANNKQIIKYKK
jgi:hypothetical protein